MVEPSEPRNRTRAWDLILDVVTAPGKAMAQIAAERPVGAATLLVVVIGVFTAILGMVGAQDALVADFGTSLLDMPAEVRAFAEALMGQATVFGAIFGAVGTVLWWFVRAAVYALIGEVMGAQHDGRAMLATLGFAATPALLQAPISLMLSRLGLNWLSTLVGLGFWIWMLVLTVLAIRAALGVDTGRAVVIFLIPVAVIIGLAILAFALLVGAFISSASQIPLP